jgi:hypothetical protein
VFHFFAMGRSVRTLDDAARYRMLVAAKCEVCLRIGKFMATDLASFCGRQKRPKDLQFTCSDCGSKNVSVTLEEWGDIKQSEIVVWKPIKVTIPR